MLRLNEVCLMCIAACLTSTRALVYECYPNATLMVESPGSYSSAFANNSVRICTTTWTTGKSHVFISNCEMNDTIMVFFSNFGPSFELLVGGIDRGNATFIINCIQIPKSGELKTVNVSLETRVGLNSYSEFNHIAISSHVYENITSRVIATEAGVGTPLFWVLEAGEDNFDLRPDECWVYAGKAVLDTVPKKYLIQDGCSLSKDLALDFQWHRPATGTMVWTVLFSFRFYGSEYITLQCSVRICARPSESCEINCSSKKRRRRMSNSMNRAVDNTTAEPIHNRIEPNTNRVITNTVRVVEYVERECTPSSQSTSIDEFY